MLVNYHRPNWINHFLFVLVFGFCVDRCLGVKQPNCWDYVECFPDGIKKGNKMDKACLNFKIEGFPTWVINGQV